MNYDYKGRVHYEATTGAFTWLVRGAGITRGALVGCVGSHGYRVMNLGRKKIRACRLAWFMTYDEWPNGEIDHINGERLDDRIENLRVVDRAGNAQNKYFAQANNRSCGLLGVTWNKQHHRWQAKIMARKVRHHVGYFDTPEEAHSAYLVAKARLHIGGRNH